MQDFELEELEARLYGQVFHPASEPSETILERLILTVPQPAPLSQEQAITRQVSQYSVSNVPHSKPRYWVPIDNNFNKPQEQYLQLDNNNLRENETLHKIPENKLPDGNSVNNITKKNKRKRNKKKKKTINKYAEDLNIKCPNCVYKSFCNCVYHNAVLNPFSHQFDKQDQNKQQQFKTTNNNDSNIQNISLDNSNIISNFSNTQNLLPVSSNINPSKEKNSNIDNQKVLNFQNSIFEIENLDKTIKEQNKNDNTIVISDSDSEVEVVTPQLESVYILDSDSEISITSDTNNLNDSINTINDDSKLENDNTVLEDHFVKPKPVSTQESERDVLETPDSLNDFIDDVNEDNHSFNFTLHGSDLDLSNKDDVNKPNVLLHPTDIYETESSCSGHGTPTKNAFNDLMMHTPVKEIFHEPDLTSFSDFITPNRDKSKKTNLKQIPTKASSVLNKSNESDIELESEPIQVINPISNKQIKRIKKIKKHFEKQISNITNQQNKVSNLEYLKLEKKKQRYIRKTQKLGQKIDSFDNIEDIDFKKMVDKKEALDVENVDVLNDNEETNGKEICDEKLNKKDRNKNGAQKRKSEIKQDENEDGEISKSKSEVRKNKNKTRKIENDLNEAIKNENKINNAKADLEYKKKGNNIERENSNGKCEVLKCESDISNKDSELKKSQKQLQKNKNEATKINEDESSEESENEVDLKIKSEHQKNELSTQKMTDDDFNTNLENEIIKSVEENKTLGVAQMKDELTCDSINSDVEIQEPVIETISVLSDEDSNIINSEFDTTLDDSITLNTSSPSKKTNAEKHNLVVNPFNEDCHKRSFKDFWTPDMKKFYDESWGQENYDLNAVFESMPSDPSKWQIIDEDRWKMTSPYRKKYCMFCKEVGHVKFRCPKYHNRVVCCSICGGQGHTYSRCYNVLCTNCGSKSDYHTTSCRKCAHYKNIRCTICRMIGHPTDSCPDQWRRYHLTTDSTWPNSSPNKLKPQKEQWCSGCASRGHLYHNCSYVSREHFPTFPQVCSYKSTYDNSLVEPQTSVSSPPLQDLDIPQLQHIKLSALTKYREMITQSNFKKYGFWIKSLIKKCQEGPIQYIDQLRKLENDLRRNKFDRKKVSLLHKLRNVIHRQTR